MLSSLLVLVALVGNAIALPTLAARAHLYAQPNTVTSASWDEGAVNEYPIHSSCNTTENNQLRTALREMELLTEHAKEHVLRWGNGSEIYRKYFGDAPSAAVIGNLDRVVNGDKARTLFRCDDADGNCKLEGKLP